MVFLLVLHQLGFQSQKPFHFERKWRQRCQYLLSSAGAWKPIRSIFVILPYGVLQQNISRPNTLIKPLDEKYDIKVLKQ